ncbi:MAG TPA: ABC transporter substrate-binding protein, partial [Chloroflexota bacterium]
MAPITPSVRLRKTASAALALILLLPACAPAASLGPISESGRSITAAPKRITAAIMGEPHALYNKLNVGGTIPGTDALEELVHSNLAILDNHGELAVQIGTAIPSIENGLWKVASDGHMEMTWKIRSGARWHDGTPLTSEDLAFTIRVSRDVPEFRIPVFAGLEALETPDSSTAIARWERPYINADALFTRAVASPIPRHLLEQSFLDNKAAFVDQPYWTSEFVGTGAFKLKELVQGSHVLLEANPDYALGRPKIDTIEVKFMSGSAIVANLLANAVDVTLGRSISLEQASELVDRWTEGKLDVMPAA